MKAESITISLNILLYTIFPTFGYNRGHYQRVYHNLLPTGGYYGYSILLHVQKNPLKSLLIFSGPKSNSTVSLKSRGINEPGTVWKCDINSLNCDEFQVNFHDDSGYIKQIDYHHLIIKDRGWFGAAMSIDPVTDELTVCAPRTVISIFSLSSNYFSMHGVCYSGNVFSKELNLIDKKLSSHNFSTHNWYNPMHGFSVHTFNIKSKNMLVIGSPNHQLDGSIKIHNQRNPVFLPTPDAQRTSEFGYAVSSGCFFNEKILIVGGAPGRNLVGSVELYNPDTDPPTFVLTLTGKTYGEYFGASLAVGDLNNDGFDELIIGAPHWGDDYGRVYIYFGGIHGFNENVIILSEMETDSQFGYSMTCGDLDSDGFDELIVGAPWEGNGVIYIYYGEATIGSKQDLYSYKEYSTSDGIKTFGFSLAKPVDLDNNGFPDFAVGAYKSNYVEIIMSSPVIKTSIQVITLPRIIERNSTNFVIKVCVNHTKNGLTIELQSFNLTIDVDKKFQRVNQTDILFNYFSTWKKVENFICLEYSFYFLEYIQNRIDPIDIVVTHKFDKTKDATDRKIDAKKLFPVEYKGLSSKISVIKLPFDIGCGNDGVCSAEIIFSGSFYEPRDHKLIKDNTWIIGSHNLNFEVNFKNVKEPAFSTVIILKLPKGIFLRSLLSFCRVENKNDTTDISCNVENPLINNIEKKILFDLDMSRLNDGSVDGSYLNFSVFATSRSILEGTPVFLTSLFLKSNMSLQLLGNTNDRIFYFSFNHGKFSNISFEHTYHLTKFGDTPITKANIIVKIPVKFNGTEIIYLARQPRIFSSSEQSSECSVVGINVIEKKITSTSSVKVIANHTRSQRDIDYSMERLTPLKFNGSSKNSNLRETLSDTLVYLNCSGADVQCGHIICDVDFMNWNGDNRYMIAKFILNPSKFIGKKLLEENRGTVEFMTEGWIDVIHPNVSYCIPGSKNVTEVSTVFTNLKQIKEINIWVFIGSIFIGLVVFCLVAYVLKMIGFFNRTRNFLVIPVGLNEIPENST